MSIVNAEFVGGPRCGEHQAVHAGTYEYVLHGMPEGYSMTTCVRPPLTVPEYLRGTYRYNMALTERFYGVDEEGTRPHIFTWRGWE